MYLKGNFSIIKETTRTHQLFYRATADKKGIFKFRSRTSQFTSSTLQGNIWQPKNYDVTLLNY